MLQSKILLAMAILIAFAFLSQSSLLELAEIIDDIQNATEKKEICDETDNIGNWQIYCSGPILAAMNLHQVENDSKDFVDRPLKDDPQVVLSEFKKEFGETIANISAEKLINFRKRFFGEPGMELKKCSIAEWKELPPKIARIKDKNLRDFAVFLNRRWKDLCRQINNISDPNRNSLIEVPYPFIVPGGRFREYYYWDAYWIVKGLIASELFIMVKNMLMNFIHCVKKFGFVPNGGRIYFLRRSQPPFLIPMVYEYYEATRDKRFIADNFQHLIKEYNFWHQNRSMEIKDKKGYTYTVYQYKTISNVPRPESYRADIEVAVKVKKNKQQKLFQDIASAAESGWTFSSRWFSDRKTLKTVETTDILPVDLNALLCWNANILKYFADIIGNAQKAEEFGKFGQDARKALNDIFYNETEKAWFDYNLRTKSHNTLFYATVAVPLFTGCYTMLDYDKSAKRSRVFHYPSGVPVSMRNTGQQWDLPNGWPPMQHMIIEGMRKSNNPEAQEMAFKMAQEWILTNYMVYNTTGKMWEKIDVTGTIPKPGIGGEYDVQDGFGWTNGVVLDLLVNYYDRLTTKSAEENISRASATSPSSSAYQNISHEICRSKAYHIQHSTIIFIVLCAAILCFFT